MSHKLVQRVEQKENDMKTLERVQEPSKIPIQAPAVPPKRTMAAMNVFVRFLLRSPFNFRLGNTLMLLTYTGRKSGKRYTNPVSYMAHCAQTTRLGRSMR